MIGVYFWLKKSGLFCSSFWPFLAKNVGSGAMKITSVSDYLPESVGNGAKRSRIRVSVILLVGIVGNSDRGRSWCWEPHPGKTLRERSQGNIQGKFSRENSPGEIPQKNFPGKIIQEKFSSEVARGETPQKNYPGVNSWKPWKRCKKNPGECAECNSLRRVAPGATELHRVAPSL